MAAALLVGFVLARPVFEDRALPARFVAGQFLFEVVPVAAARGARGVAEAAPADRLGCRPAPRGAALSGDARRLPDASGRFARARASGPRLDRARGLVRPRARRGGGNDPPAQRRHALRAGGRSRLRIARARPLCGHVPALVPGAAGVLQPRDRSRRAVPRVPQRALGRRRSARSRAARMARAARATTRWRSSRTRAPCRAPSCRGTSAASRTRRGGWKRWGGQPTSPRRRGCRSSGRGSGEEPGGQASLALRAIGPDLAVDARVERRAFVATSLPDWPGWRAIEDGRAIALETVNHAFVGFWLEPGPHRVRLSYRPPSWPLGLAASVGGLVAALAMGIRGRSALRPPGENGSRPPGPSRPPRP